MARQMIKESMMEIQAQRTLRLIQLLWLVKKAGVDQQPIPCGETQLGQISQTGS
jgi:hypothetical protein